MDKPHALIAIDIATRMAQEGIPVGAIARVLQRPFEDTIEMLTTQVSYGNIVELPKSDWPPTAKLADHVPSITRKISDHDVMFVCQKMFHLTKLEAGFLVLLLKLEHASKAQLHNVIETQRLERHDRPDSMELTDQKMVDVMICKLRKKLKEIDTQFIITTVWGGGYYIEAPVKEKIYASLAQEGVERNDASPASVRSQAVHAGTCRGDAPRHGIDAE
jgi:DNA-binding winged helix-turn-helix (wHTH) protein